MGRLAQRVAGILVIVDARRIDQGNRLLELQRLEITNRSRRLDEKSRRSIMYTDARS